MFLYLLTRFINVFFFLIPDSLILFKIYDIAHQKKKKKEEDT